MSKSGTTHADEDNAFLHLAQKTKSFAGTYQSYNAGTIRRLLHARVEGVLWNASVR